MPGLDANALVNKVEFAALKLMPSSVCLWQMAWIWSRTQTTRKRHPTTALDWDVWKRDQQGFCSRGLKLVKEWIIVAV